MRARARPQAESKQKIIDKMVEAGLVQKVLADPVYRFKFPACDTLPPPVLGFKEVSFSYSGKKEDYLYQNLNFGVDLDSRIALVGPNGAGKSTLLKLMLGWISPCEGDIARNGHLRIGQYNQHSEDQLDLQKSPYEFLRGLYPDGVVTEKGVEKWDLEQWRQRLGQFGAHAPRARALARRGLCALAVGGARGPLNGAVRAHLPARAQASRATGSWTRCTRCRTASSRASSSASSRCATRTSCCWTSRPTTWT